MLLKNKMKNKKTIETKYEDLAKQIEKQLSIFEDLSRKESEKDEPDENAGKLSLYNDVEWKLLVLTREARKYNLGILRGQIKGTRKGIISAAEDYENAQGIYNGIVRGKQYSDEEAEKEKQRVRLLI